MSNTQRILEYIEQTIDRLRKNQDYRGAIAPARISLKITQEYFGHDHLNTAISLSSLALICHEMGNYLLAREHNESALKIFQDRLGEDHLKTIDCTNNLGVTLRALGDHSGAKKCYEHALAARKRTYGDEHPITAESVSDLGIFYRAMGEYTHSLELLQQALEIRRKILGELHPDTAASYHNLAGILSVMGDYTGARRYYEQALTIRRQGLGEQHPLTAETLHNLGVLFDKTGHLAESRQCLEDALSIRSRVHGRHHPKTASTLNHLGKHLHRTGAVERALECQSEALTIRRAILGEDHLETAKSLRDIGLLLKEIRDFVTSRQFLERAFEIHRTRLGEDHPETAASLGDLGLLLMEAGEYESARKCFEQVLANSQRIYGDDHLSTATAFNNLGVLFGRTGNWDDAYTHLSRSLEIKRHSIHGTNAAMTYQGLINLASILVALGREDEAWNHIQEATRIDDRVIGEVFALSSETQRLQYMQSLKEHHSALLSFVLLHFSHSTDSAHATDAISFALNVVLRRKALVADSLAAQRSLAWGDKYPHLEPALRELSAIQTQIAQQVLAGPNQTDWDAYKQPLTELTIRRDQLESNLSQQIPEMNLDKRLRAADRRAVALALDAGVALIEYVRFHLLDFHAVLAQGESEWKPARYLAFVLRAGEPESVAMIDLGEADPIDRMIADFRACAASPPEDRTFDGTGPRDLVRRRGVRGDSSAAVALRSAVFDPLIPALAGYTHLIVAPDGELARLAFAALPMDDGRWIADVYQTSYLCSGREILRLIAPVTTKPEDPIVVCDPDFDLEAQEVLTESRKDAALGPISRDMSRSIAGVPRLPGSQLEGEAVGELLRVTPWNGIRAVKKVFLSACRSPVLLHLATHGFFLMDEAQDLDRELWGRLLDADGQLRKAVGENPLLRSGLLLAGANTFLRGGAPPEEADNGLLTALEVSSLDLHGTELVVLSACRTGEGDIRVGEGVIGLQRAFAIAGAKTLVMSLWGVDDEATRELMVGFYKRLLAGEGKAKALRHAQDDLRAKPEYADPYYWAAFICQGDQAPLHGFLKQ